MLTARTIGSQARKALSGGAGEVAAVFRRSFYVRVGGGWACCGGADLGAGPLNLLTDVPHGMDWRGILACGNPVSVRDGCLNLQTVPSIRIDTAELWAPPEPPRWSGESVRMGLCILDRLLDGRAMPEQGLGCFAREMVAPETDVAVFAEAPIRSLAAWLRGPEMGDPDIVPLLGLGPGLTPSGDDFVAASLSTLHAIMRNKEKATLLAAVSPALEKATSAISAAHLRCAAAGEMSATQHRLLNALLSADETLLVRSLDELPLDHTSNWDGLAGMATTLRAVFH